MGVGTRLASADDDLDLLELKSALDRESTFMLVGPGERGAELPRLSYRVVAADGDLLVGHVDVSVLPYARTRHRGHVVMGVRSSYHGRGVGRALLEAAISHGQGRGLRRLELTVQKGNTVALNLYHRCGFHVEGLRRGALCVDGVDIDEYWMARAL